MCFTQKWGRISTMSKVQPVFVVMGPITPTLINLQHKFCLNKSNYIYQHYIQVPSGNRSYLIPAHTCELFAGCLPTAPKFPQSYREDLTIASSQAGLLASHTLSLITRSVRTRLVSVSVNTQGFQSGGFPTTYTLASYFKYAPHFIIYNLKDLLIL